MTVELAALRSVATLDTSQYVQAATAAAEAAKRMGRAADDMGEQVQQSDVKIKGGVRTLDSLKRQIDPAYASSERLRKGIEQLNRAFADNKDPAEHARLLGLLKDRYDTVGQAARRAAQAQASAAAAQAQAAAQAAAEVAQAQAREAQQLSGLRAKYDETYAAAIRYNAALDEMARLERAGAISGASLAQAKARLEAELNPVNIALAREQAELDRLIAKLDPASAATARLAQQQAVLNSALARGAVTQPQYDKMNAALNGLGDGLDDVGKKSGKMQQAMSQAGFQINDVAMQVSTGGNAIAAVGLQLGQLLQVFGTWGSIIGAVVAVLGMYIAKLWESDEAAKAAKKAEEEWGDALEMSRSIMETSEQTQIRLLNAKRDAAVETAKATLKIREETEALAEQEVVRARIGLQAAKEMRDRVQGGSTAEAAGVVDVGVQRAEQRIANLADMIPKLTASTEEARKALQNLLNPPDSWNNPALERANREAANAAEQARKAAEEEAKRRQGVLDKLGVEWDERTRVLEATKAGADAVRNLNRDLAGEAAAREVLGAATNRQARHIAEANPALAEQAAHARQLARDNYDLEQATDAVTEAEKKRTEALKVAAREQQQEIERYARDLARTSERISEDVAEDIYDGLTGKDADIMAWFKSLLKRMAVEALAAKIILPITTAVVGSLPGLFGVQAPAGGAGAAGGGGSGAAGQLLQTAGGQALNASGVFGAGGTVSTLMGTTLINGTTTGAITQSGSLAAAYSAPSTIAGSAGGLTVGGALGAAGIGYAAGGLVGGWVGNKTGSRVAGGAAGAASGAAAGAALGSVVPGIGTLAGAIVGGIAGLLGGALGTSSLPSNKEGNASVDLATGRTVVGGQEGKKFSQENRDAAQGAAEAYAQIAGLLGGYSGQSLRGNLKVIMGDRDGVGAQFDGSRTTFDRTEAGIGQMTKWFVAKFTDQLGASLNTDIATAIGRIDWRNLEQAIADINFAGSFQDSLKALNGGLGLVDEAAAAARAEVETLAGQITEFRESALRLGLSTFDANNATRSYVESLLGMREAAPAMNETETAVALLNVRFNAMGPLLAAVGIEAGEAAKGLERAIAALRQDFIGGLDREFNALRGAEWINSIDDAFTILADRLRSAAALGGGDAEALRNNDQAIRNILAELSNEQLAEAASRYGGAIAEIARAIIAAGGVTAEAFDLAGWLRDLGREGNELAGRGWINQVGDQLSSLGERLAIAAREGAGASESLANNHMAITNILTGLSDPQLAEAAARFGGGIAEIAQGLLASRQALAAAEAAAAAQEAARQARETELERRVQDARQAVQDAFGREIAAQNELAAAAEATRNRMRQFATSLKDFRQGLLLGDNSPLSPEQRYSEARRQFEDIAGRAEAGDPEALEQLQRASSAFLDQSRSYYASSEQYARDFARVQAALVKAEASAGKQADAAATAAAAAQAQVSLLQQQLQAALGTQTAVLSVAQAVAALSSAILQQVKETGATGNSAAAIEAAYQQYLGRGADAGGLANWQGAVNGGTPIGSVVGGIANSDEAFIRGVYISALGREPESSGLSTWGNALAGGMTRAQVEAAIRASEEARARGYEAGGLVANGAWNRDSVRAVLAGGEFVTQARAVNANTIGTLAHINRTGAAPALDSGELRALVGETRRQTAALQEGFIRLLKLTERQTQDIADLRSAERRKAAS